MHRADPNWMPPGANVRAVAATPGRAPSLLRGLLFALFAGLCALPWQLLFGVLWDYDTCLGPYLLGLVVLAVIVAAPSWRRALSAGLLAACLCGALALTLPALPTATLAVLVVLGLTRSAVLFPRPFARALAFELVLALLASAAFALLHDSGPVGNSLAVWSFWLVQSAFALLPGAAQASDPLERDPFESAVAAAEALMQEPRT